MNSIHEFFEQTGCDYQIYEMGRVICPVTKKVFSEFEETTLAWSWPFLQHAWLAVLFWEKSSNDNQTVWFLKLPLDEQSKLNPIARDDFLRRLYHSLEQFLTHSDKHSGNVQALQTLESGMKDNPYGFKPNQEKMANFHAIVTKQFKLQPSKYYPHAVDYFSGSSGYEQWASIGYQGIADLAARLDEKHQGKNIASLLTEAIAHLPDEPIQALGSCLENHAVNKNLALAIQNQVQLLLQQHERRPLTLAAFIRMLAQSPLKDIRQSLLISVLQSPAAADVELLASLSGRCWGDLAHEQISVLFLEALAKTPQHSFNAIINDLMFIPGMRELLLSQFRSPQRSAELAKAIGLFFSQFNT